MYCCKCNHPVTKCTCGDMTERMRGPTGPGGHVAAQWCAGCDNHYSMCRCTTPIWRLRSEGVLGPMPPKMNRVMGKGAANG